MSESNKQRCSTFLPNAATISSAKKLSLLAVCFLCSCGGSGGDPGTTIPSDDEPGDSSVHVPALDEPGDSPVDIPILGEPGDSAIDVPTLTETGFLLGTDILGTIYKYHPNSGSSSRFSDLREIDSYDDFTGSVDVADNSIIIVSDDNALNVLDMETGDFLWDVPLGNYQRTSTYTPSAPVCAENLCYAIGSGGDLVAVDISTRSTIWSTDLFPLEDNQIRVKPLLVTKDRIFAGGGRNSTVYGNVEPKLYVVSRKTGVVLQEMEAGYPSMAGDLLLISNNSLNAYDFDTLQPVWTLNLDAASTPAVVGDVLAIHTVDSDVAGIEGQRIIGVSRTDGSILWVREAGTMQSFYSPVTDGRLIYSTYAVTCSNQPCSRGYPMALNPADGSLVWVNEDVDIKGPEPIVVEGRLLYDDVSTFRDIGYGYNIERGVASLDASDGSINWISLGGHSFYSLAAIFNGKVIRSSSEPTFVADR